MSFTFQELKKYSGIWRVDGIGEISSKGNSRAHITVCFSEINRDSLAEPYKNSSLTGENLQRDFRSSAMDLLKVGTIWENGKQIKEADNLGSYTIDTNRIRIFRLDEPVQLNSTRIPYVIPRLMFRFEDNLPYLKFTYYAFLPVLSKQGTQWMVIPASELYRFYIGVSSRFCNAGLTGRFNQYIDWSQSNMVHGYPYITLKKYIDKTERFVLLNALSSQAAYKNLFMPHHHISSTSAKNRSQSNQTPLTIRSSFPFSSRTNLTVAGKRIKLSNKTKDSDEEWAVFAMEIISCSHAPAFSQSTVNHDYNPRTEPKEGNYKKGAYPGHGTLPDTTEDIELNDDPADKKIKRPGFRRFSNRFKNMHSIKYFHHRPKAHYTKHNMGITKNGHPVEGYTLNEGNYEKGSKGNVGIALSDKDDSCTPGRDISRFIEMIQYLNILVKDKGWKINTRKLADGIAYGKDIITMFPHYLIPKRFNWYKIKEPNKERPRQVAWVEVCFSKDQYFYIAEIELKPKESGCSTLIFHENDFKILSNKTFEDLLILTAIKHTWPADHHVWNKHPKYINKAEKLLNTIKPNNLTHPQNLDFSKKGAVEKWAKFSLNRIEEKLNLSK